MYDPIEEIEGLKTYKGAAARLDKFADLFARERIPHFVAVKSDGTFVPVVIVNDTRGTMHYAFHLASHGMFVTNG